MQIMAQPGFRSGRQPRFEQELFPKQYPTLPANFQA